MNVFSGIGYFFVTGAEGRDRTIFRCRSTTRYRFPLTQEGNGGGWGDKISIFLPCGTSQADFDTRKRTGNPLRAAGRRRSVVFGQEDAGA